MGPRPRTAPRRSPTRIARLETALATNRRIGMAIGVLPVRHRLTADHAFNGLRQDNDQRDVRLPTLADDVVSHRPPRASPACRAGESACSGPMEHAPPTA
jgi:hypothetical protein